MNMRRVYVTRALPNSVRARLALDDLQLAVPRGEPPDIDELRAEAARSDALVVTISEHLDDEFFNGLDQGQRLRVVSSMSTGVDHIDRESAREAGVEVLHLPGSVTAPATAELTWALVLAAARGVLPAANDLLGGRWTGWDPWQWNGMQLDGATLGIVGFGAIGARVARYAVAFGMDVLCTTRTVPAPEMHPHVSFVELLELAERSNVITLHVPRTPATIRLVDAEFLARMQPGTVLINAARGGVVDEQAVLKALDSGLLGAFGMDVHAREPVALDDPLVRHARVLALPHIGSATTTTRVEMAVGAVQAAISALREFDEP